VTCDWGAARSTADGEAVCCPGLNMEYVSDVRRQAAGKLAGLYSSNMALSNKEPLENGWFIFNFTMPQLAAVTRECQYSTLQYSAPHYSTVLCWMVHLQLHHAAARAVTRKYTTLHPTTVQYSTVLCWIQCPGGGH